MLIVVRHGQTEANAGGLVSGRTDVPLTELGRRQAAALARGLGPPARVVSSPLKRARQTAEAFGVPVEVDDRWVELDFGELDGRRVDSVPQEIWTAWQADSNFAPAGGETLEALGVRVRAACEELGPEASTADVVVVTHVSPIKAAVAWALGVGDEVAWRLYVDDAAVCRIGFGPLGPLLVAFNQRYPPADATPG